MAITIRHVGPPGFAGVVDDIDMAKPMTADRFARLRTWFRLKSLRRVMLALYANPIASSMPGVARHKNALVAGRSRLTSKWPSTLGVSGKDTTSHCVVRAGQGERASIFR